MSVYVYDSIESMLEILCLYLLTKTIDQNSSISNLYELPVLMAGPAAVSLTFLYLHLSFTTVFFFIAYVLLLFILSNNSLHRTIFSASLAFLVFFFLEFVGLTVFRQIWGAGFVHDHGLVILLLGIILLVSLAIWRGLPEITLHGLQQIRRLPLTVLFCGDIVIFISIITNLWTKDSSAFFTDYGSILLQIMLFCFITCTSGYLLAGNISQRSRNRLMTEYNALLEQTMEDMRQREHEYKNELNVILSIAEHREPYSLDMIKSYTQQLYMEAKAQPAVALVKDNPFISFLLLRYRQMANRQGISFSVEICAPFPGYPIPEKELLEVLSNLLNNAFEAASELAEPERSVLISFSQDGITVSNTFLDRNGDLSELSRILERGYSSKGVGHGYGLSNVMKIAKRYRFRTRMSVRENMFCFELNFSLGN